MDGWKDKWMSTSPLSLFFCKPSCLDHCISPCPSFHAWALSIALSNIIPKLHIYLHEVEIASLPKRCQQYPMLPGSHNCSSEVLHHKPGVASQGNSAPSEGAVRLSEIFQGQQPELTAHPTVFPPLHPVTAESPNTRSSSPHLCTMAISDSSNQTLSFLQEENPPASLRLNFWLAFTRSLTDVPAWGQRVCTAVTKIMMTKSD